MEKRTYTKELSSLKAVRLNNKIAQALKKESKKKNITESEVIRLALEKHFAINQ